MTPPIIDHLNVFGSCSNYYLTACLNPCVQFLHCIPFIILSVVEVGPDGSLKVELHKTSAGLGFSLEGGRASAQGDRPLHVKRIFKGKNLIHEYSTDVLLSFV